MRNTKIAFTMFAFYDRTGIEKYLKEQARKGWLLEKISSFGWKFRRIEPKDIHFSVTYFPGASAFDAEPSEKQLRFQEFCAHTGWNLAASGAQLQIFYNEATEPVPIETDAVIDVENVHKAVKKSFLPTYITYFFLGLMQLGLFIYQIESDITGLLSGNAFLIAGLCWVIMLVQSVVEIAAYYRWRVKAKKAAELDGSFVETKRRSHSLMFMLLILMAFAFMLLSFGDEMTAGIVVGCLIGVFVIAAAAIGLSEMMKRKKTSTETNRALSFVAALLICIVFINILGEVITGLSSTRSPQNEHVVETYEYGGWTEWVFDYELPLTIEELMETDYDGYSYERISDKKSPLLAEYKARQNPRMDALDQPWLWYRIVDVKLPALYDICVDHLLQMYDDRRSVDIYGNVSYDRYRPVDAAPWGAEAAYQLWDGDSEPEETYLICYDGRIVELQFDWEPTQEQMGIVGAKLGGR